MTYGFPRKTALIALVILLLAACVFFACACEKAETVTVDFFVEEEIIGGETLSLKVAYTGPIDVIASYEHEECLFTIVEGENVASVRDGKLVIAEAAEKGAAFTVRLEVKGITLTKEFIVSKEKPIVIESVTVLCPDQATAGERISLGAEILPAGVNVLPVYTLLSGRAAIEGNILIVSDEAGEEEIRIVATAAGVASPEKSILITTVQTRELYLTFSRDRGLPGEALPFVVTKEPTESSYPIDLSIEGGEGIAAIDLANNVILIEEDAPMHSSFTVIARSGQVTAEQRIYVDYPAAEEISTRSGGIVSPGGEKTIEYSLYPATADRSLVRFTVEEGEDYIAEWEGGDTFRVAADAPNGAEITFLLEVSEDVFTTASYRVGSKEIREIVIATSDSTSYLRSGTSVTFTHTTVPAEVAQTIRYRATAGSELVSINGNVVTVVDGADIGIVKVVGESEDGTVSNEVEISVSGRYSRRVYSNWASVGLAAHGENASIWMVLPSTLNANGLTVLVPYDVVDLVIEGRYDGSDETAYRDLSFYFRNTAQRKVTLWNFGTIATLGLGGTVMDFGSSGTTEIVLKGQNCVCADTPYYIDNTGEKVDGEWNNDYSAGSGQEAARRAGKSGYRGTAGGTAISGYSLTFTGQGGTLRAVAGNGTNGTAGGKGADAVNDGSLAYLSGAGGQGGNGGDSGSAIYAYYANFLSGYVTAIPGNAGVGGAGGTAGSLAAVAGLSASKFEGASGTAGENGTPYPAVNARIISGTHYSSSVGEVRSTKETFLGRFIDLVDRLSVFYDVTILYGTNLSNPYANKTKKYKYTMTQQTDQAALTLQTNFLMYTMSQMPKNCWREIVFRSENPITIYFAKTITSGSGGGILGLTNDMNSVWFATFETALRGVLYSGYFNIMLHEFVHVFHYNFSKSARTTFETTLTNMNYGLDYKVTYGSTERVYGMERIYDESNSCFFTTYSRKNVMEDASETISMAATFLYSVVPMNEGTRLRQKVLYLSEAFSREYETLSPFITGKVLFADRRLATA